MLNSADHEIYPANKSQIINIANSFLLNIAEHENFSANMKMPTVVGIFIFISRENFMLSCVEHEKGFLTSGPGKYYFLIPPSKHVVGPREKRLRRVLKSYLYHTIYFCIEHSYR